MNEPSSPDCPRCNAPSETIADRTTICDQVPEPHKMYVFVRRDLAPGLRSAQGMHAVAELCLRYPEKAWEWNKGGNYMIVVEAEDVHQLFRWAQDTVDMPYPHYFWHEPDLCGELTAVAVLPPPERNSDFREMPLAYKETWLDRLVRWTGEK